jgi:hypothetical protein
MHETTTEHEHGASARIGLAKALLQLEPIPRLKAEVYSLREDTNADRQARSQVARHAAVRETKLEAAHERAVQAESFGAES